MFVIKKNRKKKHDYQRIKGKNKPRNPPAFGLYVYVCLTKNKVIDNKLGSNHSDGGSKTVGHHHKNTLRGRANTFIGFLIDKQRTRNIEKVKSNAVNNHR